jgi:hypothetical protein
VSRGRDARSAPLAAFAIRVNEVKAAKEMPAEKRAFSSVIEPCGEMRHPKL